MNRESENQDVQDVSVIRKAKPRFKLKELKDSVLVRKLGAKAPPACMFMGHQEQ